MPELHATSEIPCSADALRAWYDRAETGRIVKPGRSVAIVGNPQAGGSAAQWGPLRFAWRNQRRKSTPQCVVDEQIHGPFERWIHTTRFEPMDDDRSRLVDFVRYDLPRPAQALAQGRIERAIKELFAWRHRRIRQDLERHAHFLDEPRLRVAVAGSSGLVGSALVAYLRSAGHEVLRLVRNAARAADEIAWDPGRGRLDAHAMEGIDAVVHLGGANIASGRWTRKRKQAIAGSRVNSTNLLSQTLANLRKPPRVFVCASAIGYYGHRGDALLTEDDPPGVGFLADTAIDWERATRPAAEAGIRTVNLRIGVVLAAEDGALKSMLPAFRFGLGGPLGAGDQQFSWIALEDLLGLIEFALHRDVMHGPVNATAPHPVTQKRFAETLGEVLGRPAVMTVPSFAIRLGLGEMGEALLLQGQRVLPIAAARSGFQFLFPTLPEALRWELGILDDKAAKETHFEHYRALSG